jgi:hypothetical protein
MGGKTWKGKLGLNRRIILRQSLIKYDVGAENGLTGSGSCGRLM